MFKLILRPEAIADLHCIRKDDARTFARLLVLLQEIEADYTVLAKLADDGVLETQNFDVDVTPFRKMQKMHFDMWRIKAYEFGSKIAIPYRLIYAVDNVKQDYHLFAVMKRNDGNDYENDPALVARIRDVYLQLGLPFADR